MCEQFYSAIGQTLTIARGDSTATGWAVTTVAPPLILPAPMIGVLLVSPG